ncbi:hypothetical protein B0H65DRAFT_546540 [Neurospora tetraspora]|uniref:Uncharacterized protein n=1 Tax=Neurospora tetraspora TaxID=94610 RepID=A0AAE0JKX8_9PEZI|nr:hypothetical protein B0H65DRAFT_546540 [Neurospora tetraspora]
MSPTHTMSAHLCSTSPEPHATSPLPSPTNSSVYSGYFQRSPSPEQQHKRSMDSDRSSSSNWRWNNKDNSR